MWSFGTTMTMPKDSESASKAPLQPHSQPPQPLQLDAIAQTPAAAAASPLQEPRSSILSQRSLKQLGLFFAGAGFLSLATLITRRSIVRKRIATIPKFYTQSNRPVDKIGSDSSLIALEALNLATLNVLGFGIMMTGGISWAFDISSIDDLRTMARKHIGPSGGRTDEEAEREVEEWVAKVLLRKEKQEQAAADPMVTPPKSKGD
ncbi:hypothetical protein F5B22DRAFT_367568 [Xylaria bambusicola]|uniref:uncharacterized protein n=1 Tax=Xylaria bambusicola TaxID=326684 RepID=UPI0020081004|nr:uncharacterized protein F5B22DRAFT_367568 [Xylaria bambusicola]KAI0509237.1 hypothetical protein F5B22DRAFT_367568 [Xylaria bambusicola]